MIVAMKNNFSRCENLAIAAGPCTALVRSVRLGATCRLSQAYNCLISPKPRVLLQYLKIGYIYRVILAGYGPI